jgi:cystathionine beta-lyase/cystathionine gamma-synthase
VSPRVPPSASSPPPPPAPRRRLGFSTRAIHGNPEVRPDWSPVSTPIYQSSTFTNPIGSGSEVIYTRYGNNPNQLAIGKRLALLEGAEAALFTASGMGATALAHLAVLRPGDHLLSSEWIYGGVHRLFTQEFGRLGIEVSFVNPLHSRSWKQAMKKTTRAVFVESPTNPLLRVIDLEPVALLCKTEGLAMLVDSTFASPINLRPIEHGADLVIHSATKYLNGHTDVIAGAVAGTEPVIEEIRKLMQVWGQAIDPMAAWLIDRGLRTLGVRVERHNANGLAVAQWCSQQKAITRVHYPGLPTHPDHEVATRILGGFGGMLGIELKGGVRAAERFLRALKIAAHAPSLGGCETLVSEPRLTSHASLSPEERERAGIPDGFLRFSLGLEDADDLIADFAQALAQL